MLTDLEIKILLTLSYTDQFNYPLTTRELLLRLVKPRDIYSLDKFKTSLFNLVTLGHISYIDSHFSINNSLNSKRNIRKSYSIKKWEEAISLTRKIRNIPWIKGVLVTGSLAVDNAKKDDDIDLMIVTSKNRLWLTRLVTILFASANGKRRSWSREEKNSWCFNLFIDETALKLDDRLHTVYGAYELSQAVWLYSRAEVKEKFFKQNKWVKRILPSYYLTQRKRSVHFLSSHDLYMPIISELLSMLNYLSYIAQYIYMKKHMTREKVGLNHAFFHPRDTHKNIFENWKLSISKIRI